MEMLSHNKSVHSFDPEFSAAQLKCLVSCPVILSITHVQVVHHRDRKVSQEILREREIR